MRLVVVVMGEVKELQKGKQEDQREQLPQTAKHRPYYLFPE